MTQASENTVTYTFDASEETTERLVEPADPEQERVIKEAKRLEDLMREVLRLKAATPISFTST